MQTMTSSYTGLLVGLSGAILLVYLLIVINFQSWLDPFIIITALPGALAGIVWMLLITGTTLSVPALTGAIMCMGVATANSILLVSFARERMNAGATAAEAALDAGITRFRPVLMTALAMIIGMLPMALGLGEGGEQNAPLGRAVIGGLLFATVATLFFVPAVAISGHKRFPGLTNVILDHKHAAKLTLQHLRQLGHERIVYMKGQRFSADAHDRWKATRQVASEFGMKIQPDSIIQLTMDTFSPEVGYPSMQEFLAKRKDFTALVAYNDFSAIGAIRALREYGLRVPEDVAVIGFDSTPRLEQDFTTDTDAAAETIAALHDGDAGVRQRVSVGRVDHGAGDPRWTSWDLPPLRIVRLSPEVREAAQ